MNPIRKRKMLIIVLIILVLTLAIGLILYALRQNISLFYSPSEVKHGQAPNQQRIRLGGMVVKGSVVHGRDDLSVEFKLTDFKETITVHYKGILPDLFREGQGIIALGKLNGTQDLDASEVLAKHDANYMPPEVKQALIQGEKKTA